MKAKDKGLRYYYLNGKLNKVLDIKRKQDLVTCWCYPCATRHAYMYSDFLRKRKQAISRKQLAGLLNRHPDRLKRAMRAGNIPIPAMSYTLDDDRKPLTYFFTEDEAMEAYDYFSTVHIGRPRKDGRTTNNSIPSRAEFRMLVQGRKLWYTKEDGEFVPIFMEGA